MIRLRLAIALTFVGYLLAGTSLALPPGPGCPHCVKNTRETVKPGTACPLSHRQQHCHNGQHSQGRLVLCPGGCVHHAGQEGAEVPPLPKFTVAALLPPLPDPAVTAQRPTPEIRPPQVFFPPPLRPPAGAVH